MASQVQKHLSMLMGAYKAVKRRLEELESEPEPPKVKRSRPLSSDDIHDMSTLYSD